MEAEEEGDWLRFSTDWTDDRCRPMDVGFSLAVENTLDDSLAELPRCPIGPVQPVQI